jgi:hypothetical protein
MKKLLAILLICLLIVPYVAAVADVASIEHEVDNLNIVEKQELFEYLRHSISVDNSKNNEALDYTLFKRSNPMTVGQTAVFLINGVKCYMTLVSVVRGDPVNKEVKKANMFNAEPPVGQEYMKVLFHLSTIADDSSDPIEINQFMFKYVSSSGKVNDAISMVSGMENSITVYSGGEGDFIYVTAIDKKDKPTLVFDDVSWIDLSGK